MNTAILRAQIESALRSRVAAPFTFRAPETPPVVRCGVPEIDSLTSLQGLPRGALTEIFGPDSSGRTTFLLSLLAQMTAHDEACALIDSTDAFDPHSAQAAGVQLDRLLWTRCRNLEQALRATDLVLGGGGFGLVAIDLSDVPPRQSRRVPLACWFRFRRVIERTPTLLVLLGRTPCARTCASLVVRLATAQAQWTRTADQRPGSRGNADAGRMNRQTPAPAWHACLLCGTHLRAELVRSRFV